MEIRNGGVHTATGSVGSFSDERLKQPITPFSDGLYVINQINPIKFEYKPDAPFNTADEQMRIIAQEQEKVAPCMVHKTAEGNVKALRWVDNQSYIFLLINAVQELTIKNQQPQSEIEWMKQAVLNDTKNSTTQTAIVK